METYMGLAIRRAVRGDIPAVDKLLREVLALHHEGRPDLFRAEGKKYTDEELGEIFADPDAPVLVAEDGGTVLGYVFCVVQRPSAHNLQPVTTLYIDDLCVDASARGRGVGKALFGGARELAVSLGCHNMTLHVWAGNPAARGFYEAMGMSPQYTSMEMLL